ncbi:MAG TPA: hypothetical protein VFH51_15020, partial [Myxococcota bacterium]|nr:hypothetical protein [Myxococcota bacterium]
MLHAAEPDGRHALPPRTDAALAAAATAGHTDLVGQLLQGCDPRELEHLLRPDRGTNSNPSLWEQVIDADRPAALTALLAGVPSDDLLRAILAPQQRLLLRCVGWGGAESARALLAAAPDATLRAEMLAWHHHAVFDLAEQGDQRETFLCLLAALTPEGMEDLVAAPFDGTLSRMVSNRWGDVVFEILGRVSPETRRALLGNGNFSPLRRAGRLDDPAIFKGLFERLDADAQARFLAMPGSLTLALSCGCHAVAALAWRAADGGARHALLAHDGYRCIDAALFHDGFAWIGRALAEVGELRRIDERLHADRGHLLRRVVQSDRTDLLATCLKRLEAPLPPDVVLDLLGASYQSGAESTFTALLRLLPAATPLEGLLTRDGLRYANPPPGLRRRLLAALPRPAKAALLHRDDGYAYLLVRWATHRAALRDLLDAVDDAAAI